MIDKTAGLPTQIRQLEKRLKEMDASKVKPALVKEITDTIQNLKTLLKEKMDKREERRKSKEQAAAPAEVEKEAISVPNAADVGAVAQNPPAPAAAPGAPAATPDDQKVSCPLCGGMTFNDNASYQQHMAYTHVSDIMPTNPGQKQDNLVAAVEAPVAAPETAPKETGPQFKLDDVVKPTRGSESTGKVMRWDGKPSDLVYVSWESGPLADRDGFGGYYPHDLELFKEELVEAAMPMEKPVCADCVSMKEKHGDLKTNYESLLKDLKEERDIHYTQGNSSWVARLDQKILDLQKSIEEKFGIEPEACSACGQKKQAVDILGPGKGKCPNWDYHHIGTKCETCGLDERDIKRNPKEAGAQNAEDLTIMDHTPPRANSGPDAGGKDSFDEFQDEWSEPARDVESSKSPINQPTKLLVFKREFLATPVTDQKKFGGYEISQNGKKLFKINSSNSQPMTKEQLEFCAQIELTRGFKQAKLTEKIAFLDAGSTVYILAADKPQKRIKFASMEHGIRGWAPVSKFAFLAKEAEMRKHHDHIDNTFGHNGKEMLVDCPNGSGNMVWLPINELLPIQAPPATPESLNEDLGKDSAKECPDCHGTFEGAEGQTCPTCGSFAVQKEALRPALPPQILNRRQEVNASKGACSRCKKEDGTYNPNTGVCDSCEDDMRKEASLDKVASGCDQCAATMINGIFCHEHGCPNQKRKQRDLDDDEPGYIEDEASVNKKADYEGWSNYDTWGLALWLDNDQQLYNESREMAKNHADNESLAAELAATYNGLLEEKGEEDKSSNKVNWNEIAQDLLNESKENKEYERSQGAGGVIDKLPTMDIEKAQDEVLNQLAKETDPEKKKSLEQKYRRLTMASLKKKATVVHRTDGWHVLSEKGKNLGGPYKTKGEATKRLREVEYFKHQGVFRPFSKQVYAEVLTDPYQTLSTHITEMRTRMDQVNERLQNAPAVKTAKEDAAPEMDLAALFADLTQGIDLLETKLGGDDIEPELHKGVEELENKLWTLEEKLGLTPKLSEHEKEEPEHKDIVEDMEKEASESYCRCRFCGEMFRGQGDSCLSCGKTHDKEATVVTDETIEETTNDPNATLTPPATAIAPTGLQPTDFNGVDPKQMPTSPLPPGQRWQWDAENNKFIVMTDPTDPSKLV